MDSNTVEHFLGSPAGQRSNGVLWLRWHIPFRWSTVSPQGHGGVSGGSGGGGDGGSGGGGGRYGGGSSRGQ